VLHLLDTPDEVWDDPAIDRIYAQLRAEFDLVDRYAALESKLRSVQEALELVLDVAPRPQGALLEASIVALIVFEIVLSLYRGTEPAAPVARVQQLEHAPPHVVTDLAHSARSACPSGPRAASRAPRRPE
jgi:hypothetical protein